MAKSKRSSSRKANNQRLAATLFGPAVTARAERMSAKLLELAKQPKPETSDAKTEGMLRNYKETLIETNQSARAEDADVVEDEPAEDEPVEAGDAGMFPPNNSIASKHN